MSSGRLQCTVTCPRLRTREFAVQLRKTKHGFGLTFREAKIAHGQMIGCRIHRLPDNAAGRRVRQAGVIRPGDRLCQVDGRVVMMAPWHHIVDQLKSFNVGDTARLTFKRVSVVGESQARCRALPNAISIHQRAAEAAARSATVRREAEAAVARAEAMALADANDDGEDDAEDEAVGGADVALIRSPRRSSAATAAVLAGDTALLTGRFVIRVLRAMDLRDVQVRLRIDRSLRFSLL